MRALGSPPAQRRLSSAAARAAADRTTTHQRAACLCRCPAPRRPVRRCARPQGEGKVLVKAAATEHEDATGEAIEGKAKVVYLNAVSACEVPVEGATGAGIEVENYLNLPIEQYFIADPDRMTKVSDNEFLFRLPRLRFFNVWVAPQVTMSVQLEGDPQTVVNIRANKCVVQGSDFIEKMKLNDKLSIKVKTSLREGSTDDHAQTLKAATNLEVWCEIVPPFNLLPKAFLEKSCNAVLRTTLNTLLKSFLVELKSDYHSWSTDEVYREERASRSKLSA